MNDPMELMRARHSVRQYLPRSIPAEPREALDGYTAEFNAASGLHMQILYDEPDCFNTRLAHYGSFESCSNYIALVGRKAPDLDERCGYWGEKLVLRAQELGLNTCWAALTHGKSRALVSDEEKEVILIALGYGKTQGRPHRGKDAAAVSGSYSEAPAWFRRGVEAALLAPTAVNQQKFRFELLPGGRVSAKAGLIGSCLKIDLGIVKCHFELGAGKENFSWAD